MIRSAFRGHNLYVVQITAWMVKEYYHPSVKDTFMNNYCSKIENNYDMSRLYNPVNTG